MMRRVGWVALTLVSGCGVGGRQTQCGIAALVGPSLLLEEFGKPGTTLSQVPSPMPETLPVRMAAGDAQRALVGKTDSSWIVGVDGPLVTDHPPGFGVLLVDRVAGPQGVLLYGGPPIPGAPVLGTVNLGELNIPFLGLLTQTAAFQDSLCPLFPDSLTR